MTATVARRPTGGQRVVEAVRGRAAEVRVRRVGQPRAATGDRDRPVGRLGDRVDDQRVPVGVAVVGQHRDRGGSGVLDAGHCVVDSGRVVRHAGDVDREPAGVRAAATVGDRVVEPSRSDPTEVGCRREHDPGPLDPRRPADRTRDLGHERDVAVGVGVVARRAEGAKPLHRQVRVLGPAPHVVDCHRRGVLEDIADGDRQAPRVRGALQVPGPDADRQARVGLEVDRDRGQQLRALDRERPVVGRTRAGHQGERVLVPRVGVRRLERAHQRADVRVLRHRGRLQPDAGGRVVLVDHLTTRDHVVARVGERAVSRPRAAPDDVGEGPGIATVQLVVALAAAETVVTGATLDDVLALLTTRQVVAPSPGQLVVTPAAAQLVVATTTDQPVVTAATTDDVVAGRAFEHVGARGPHDGATRSTHDDLSDTGARDLRGQEGQHHRGDHHDRPGSKASSPRALHDIRSHGRVPSYECLVRRSHHGHATCGKADPSAAGRGVRLSVLPHVRPGATDAC